MGVYRAAVPAGTRSNSGVAMNAGSRPMLDVRVPCGYQTISVVEPGPVEMMADAMNMAAYTAARHCGRHVAMRAATDRLVRIGC
ncbi:MAG: hypothetical protein SGPRY_000354 [Prymnesium sp.]